jgi:hypothetical protein
VDPGKDRLGTLVAAAKQAHAVPSSFKGTGTLSIHRENRVQKARIAWAGRHPEKLRVEIFGLPGHSSASVAMDEEHFYFRSNHPPRLTRRPRNAVDISDIVGVDIRPGDLFRLLGGGMPLRTHRFTRVEVPPGNASPYAAGLVAERWTGTVSQRILFEPGEKEVGAVECFDFFGRLRYRVVFDRQGTTPDRSKPRRLTVSAPGSDRFRLDIERFWPEARVDNSIFVLSEPPDTSTTYRKP